MIYDRMFCWVYMVENSVAERDKELRGGQFQTKGKTCMKRRVVACRLEDCGSSKQPAHWAGGPRRLAAGTVGRLVAMVGCQRLELNLYGPWRRVGRRSFGRLYSTVRRRDERNWTMGGWSVLWAGTFSTLG